MHSCCLRCIFMMPRERAGLSSPTRGQCWPTVHLPLTWNRFLHDKQALPYACESLSAPTCQHSFGMEGISRHLLEDEKWYGDSTGPFFGFMGAAAALVFACT